MPRNPIALTLLFCILLFQAAAVVAAAESTFDPSRFEVHVIASGLKQPMQFSVTADGTILFIELDGKLKAIDPRTHSTSDVGDLKVTTAQENGLIGMALDPNFTENGWIYLQYSPPDFPGQHVSRFTIVDGKLDLASEKLLLKFEEQRKECCHHAGSMQFGPRGELFIATGDNTHPHGDSQGYAPIDERPDKSPWDAQKSASNTNSLSGKILRIKPLPDGTIEIPDGNLFPKDGSKGRPEIYVMGCRNPWRMSVDMATGFVYWGEVGPDAGGDGPRGPRGYDEINQARRAGNFGWPYFVGNNFAYFDHDYETGKVGAMFDVNAPMNESPNNTGETRLPPAQPALIWYPSGASQEFPELASGGRTACAGPVYHFSNELKSETKFPAALDRVLFIYEWSRHWIKLVYLDDDFHVKKIESFMPGQKFVRPIDLEFGPEGSLYVMEYGETWGVNKDARLIRIDYMTGNRPPVVVASAGNNIGKEPLSVSFSSSGTLDKDAGDELKFEWRVYKAASAPAAKPGEGNTAPQPSTAPAEPPTTVSTEQNPTVTFDRPGVYNVELVVTDSHGARGIASVPVLVGNDRPTIKFLEPRAGDFFDPEQPIRYRLSVRDTEDGTNDDDAIESSGAKDLDPDSPGRVSLNATFVSGPMPAKDGSSDDQGPAGMRMMKRSDCFNCHAVDQKRVGPPLLEIATKYRGKEGAFDASVERVLKGSTGAWGKIPMIPHSQHTPEEVREMVGWVYSLEPAGLVRVFPGFVNEIPVAKEEAAKPGYYRLEASYVDRGAGDVPPLSGSATLLLRPRLIEAETADEIHGAQILGSGTAGGGKFIGAINHGHYLRINGISFDRVKHLTLKVASAGAGGSIEVRLDKPDGELLATVPVEVNGQWEKFYDKSTDIPATTGRHDVYLVFTHPGKAGGLMNLDSINFLP
jgi:cytochrome c